ncbi:MAG TPA: flavodoxin domain-containing protein [Anaerolineaceae bacterium]|nr:flavodoxin domain-containing protein [Anaerolineaceae bacterium]HPN52241.1 flavodoxin domain-containing protein [Anaerolineaceae bacterium]
MPLSINRRDFLKLTGITLGAAAVTCTGLGFAASRAPDIATPDYAFGKENQMSPRILVLYATRAGSTTEVAAAIGETLSAGGYAVDVKSFKSNPSLAGYQAVVMGSAVRMTAWLPEAVDYVKKNQDALKKMPVSVFSVHMQNTGDDETSQANRRSYLRDVRALIQPVTEGYFAGKMDFSRLSFLDKLISNLVKAKEEDQRNWDVIRGWAQAIPLN